MDDAFDDFATGLNTASLYDSRVFVDRAAAINTSIGGDVRSIIVEAYDQSVNSQWGRARYVRSDLAGVSPYNALTWFQSQDGAYWLLDEDMPDITMAGAHRHAAMSDLTHDDAVDSSAAILAIRQYANLRGVPWYIPRGYFMQDGGFEMAATERAIGVGQHLCGLQIRMNNTQTGVQMVSDQGQAIDFEIQAYLYEAKVPGGGTGMIGNCLIVGKPFQSSPPRIRNWNVDRVKLSRKPSESGHSSWSGIALVPAGGTEYGALGDITITGRHSYALMSHWVGDNDTFQDPHTESRHPRYYSVNRLDLVDANIDRGLVFASAASIRIGTMIADGLEQVLQFVPGDDTDDNNIADPNIYAQIRVDQLICNDVQGSKFPDAISVSSLGTSKWQTEQGQPKKQQVRASISIGELTMHCPDGSMLYGIDLFEFYGTFEVEHATITGFEYAYRALYSRGNIRVNFDHTDGKIHSEESDGLITGFQDRSAFLDTTDENRNAYVKAANELAVAASDITRGDTTITLSAPLVKDLVRGMKIRINGTTNGASQTLEMTLDDFTESGLSDIYLGSAVPHDFTGVTVDFIRTSNFTMDMQQCSGGKAGVYIENDTATVSGNIDPGRYGVHLFGPDAMVNVDVSEPTSGSLRNVNEAYSIYDVYIENGGTVNATGLIGAVKATNHGSRFSFGAINSGGNTDRAKVNMRNATIDIPARVMPPSDTIDVTVSGCVRANGQPYTVFDALGIEETGSDANGEFVRYENGVMECWARNVNIGATHPYTWTFPDGGFIDTMKTVVHVESANTTAARFGHGNAISATQAQIDIRNDAGATVDNAGANLRAIGRWK